MRFGEITCRFIPAKSAQQWAEALHSSGTQTSFTAAYHIMSERIWGGEAFLAVVERAGNRLVWPYILRPIPGAAGFSDINSAHGFTGPLVMMDDSTPDTHFVEDVLNHLMRCWRDAAVVSAFTRFCPFQENHKLVEGWLRTNPQISASVESTGHVVAIDVTQDPEQRWRGFRTSVQKDIRKAQDTGMRGEHDPDWERLDDFAAIYASVGERNEFAARHYLSREDFFTMRSCLGANAVMFHAMDGDRVAASSVCVISGGVIHGLFAGPHPDYLRLHAYKFLMKSLADWAAGQGLRYLNLGGGRGGSDSDSLYHFKRGLSRLEVPFYIGRLIVNAAKYEELTDQVVHRYRERGHQPAADFFPAYNAPPVPMNAPHEEEVTSGVKA